MASGLAAAVVASSCGLAAQEVGSDEGRASVTGERALMGTRFRIEVRTGDSAAARRAISRAFAEVERSEELLSNWSGSSEISAVNRSAGGGAVVVGSDLMAVLDRALAISTMTRGAFDITFAACEGAWSVRERRIPTDDEIRTCLDHVGYRRVALDRVGSAVLLPDPGMRLGLAGLAKGYRVDRAAEVLERHGIRDYAVDGGGDIRLSSSAGAEPWRISVAHPRRPGQALGVVALRSGAVATSGDYEWYFERDGVRYHHILDPTTGRPARLAVAATVLAATAMDADALATGLFVMGPAAGVELADRVPGVEALIIAPDLSLHRSAAFPDLEPAGLTTAHDAPSRRPAPRGRGERGTPS